MQVWRERISVGVEKYERVNSTAERGGDNLESTQKKKSSDVRDILTSP